jgi:hypothetical protein
MATGQPAGSAWIEAAQREIARMIATSPAGAGLVLMGGFRFRLLDRSVRTSMDIDYHCAGDLEAKQREIHSLCQRRILPEVRRRFSVEADVRLGGGPGEASPFVKVVEIALWRPGAPGRTEIPIDITHVPCLDAPTTRAVDGTLFLTASDEDMAESKILALLLRTHPVARDVLDIHLFANFLPRDARDRLRKKTDTLKLKRADVARRLQELHELRAVLVTGVRRVIREQVESGAAHALDSNQGAAGVVDDVLRRLDHVLGVGKERT